MSAKQLVESLLDGDDPKDYAYGALPVDRDETLLDYVKDYLFAYGPVLNAQGLEHYAEKIVDLLNNERGSWKGTSGVDAFEIFWAMEKVGLGKAADLEAAYFREEE